MSTYSRSSAPRLCGLVLWILVGLTCVLPLIWMLVQLAAQPSLLRQLNPLELRWALLGRTLLYNGGAAILATIMAFPAALVIGRGRGVVARVLAFVLPLGLLMPSIAYTYGWLQVFRLLHIMFKPAGPADILRCIWTLASWLWPLAAVVIGLSLRTLDSQIEQQALLDGAYWRITLRHLAGAILAAFGIVLVLAMQEFAVYERTGISVVATEVRTVFETGAVGSRNAAIAAVVSGAGALGPDQPHRAATALSVALPAIVLVFAVTIFSLLMLARLSSAERIETGDWPSVLDAGWGPLLGTIALITLTLIVPTAAMVKSIAPHRWLPDAQGHHMPVRVWLWSSKYVLGSLLVAALSGICAAGVAMLAAVVRSRGLLVIALVVFLIGGELLAIATIRLYNRPTPWPLDSVRISGRDLFGVIYNNAPVMVIAYLGRFVWLALVAGQTAWSAPLRELRDVAAVDGAGPWQTFRGVVLPLVWPVLLASAIAVTILSMTEVGATVLLSPQRPQLLVPYLMMNVHQLRYDDVLEGSLLLMAISSLLGIVCLLLTFLASRLIPSMRRMRRLTVFVPLCLFATVPLMAGCDDRSYPEAIWLETGVARGQTVYPRGFTYSQRDDCFFLVDRMARIQRIERDGHVSLDWRMKQWEAGKPVGLTIGPDGNLYVPDTHYNRVVVFDPKDGHELRQWGSLGAGPGQFMYPTDVAFDAKGNIYVSEYGDHDRIQVFDPNTLAVIREIGHFGGGNGEFARPESMVIDGELLYVTDASNHRIVVFKTDGTWVRNIGSVGSALGQFRFPYGLDMDREGHLVVAEFGNNRVQIIDKETGRGLRTWGMAGRESGQLAYPWAVAVDKRDRIVVVDSGNNRLQVFR